jgi:alpha-L-fucosidase
MNKTLKSLADWMKINGQSLSNCSPLSDSETASVPATAKNKHRYLFLMADNKSEIIQLKTSLRIKKVILLANGKKLNFDSNAGVITIPIAAIPRTELVDVIDIELK